MSRILWFSLGTIAGMAYASSAIKRERLDLLLGEDRISGLSDDRNVKTKLAERIEEQTAMISERVLETGHLIASKVRGERKPTIQGGEATAMAQTPNIRRSAGMAAPEPSRSLDDARTFTPGI